MDKELSLEEAENIVDNMYQKRWEECGVDDGNTIHMGNLDKLHYNELERASILLLRTEIRLKRENKKYKEVIDKAINIRNDFVAKNPLIIFENDALLQFVNNLLDILKEVE